MKVDRHGRPAEQPEGRAPCTVRPLECSDIPALAQLFFDAVHRIAALDYSEEQVNAWAPQVPDVSQFASWACDGRLLLVAVDDQGEPVAFGDLERNGHLDHLFCRPDHAGTGVAGLICDRLEEQGQSLGLTRIYVEASEPARRFFCRRGYRTIARRDFLIRGVPIHNHEMELLL
jgi:putative acetyltransferase